MHTWCIHCTLDTIMLLAKWTKSRLSLDPESCRCPESPFSRKCSVGNAVCHVTVHHGDGHHPREDSETEKGGCAHSFRWSYQRINLLIKCFSDKSASPAQINKAMFDISSHASQGHGVVSFMVHPSSNCLSWSGSQGGSGAFIWQDEPGAPWIGCQSLARRT